MLAHLARLRREDRFDRLSRFSNNDRYGVDKPSQGRWLGGGSI